MAIFKFKALTPKGSLEAGYVELPFETIPEALSYLERSKCTVIEIKKFPYFINKIIKLVGRKNKLKRPELAVFFNNLGILIGGGVSVLKALEELEEDTQNNTLKLLIKFISIDIKSGSSLSEAMSKHPNFFSELILNMVKIGEETGRVDKMLKKCSIHIQNLHDIITNTKRALLYPVFVIFVVLGTLIFWFTFVIPKIVSLFKEMDIKLPLQTRILIFISHYIQKYWFLFLSIVIISIILIIWLRKYSIKFKYKTDKIILNIPIIKTVIHTDLVARISEFLGILIEAGISINRTLKIITSAVYNEIYKEKLEITQYFIDKGLILSEALRHAETLHPFAIRMINVGEQTGKLEEQTQYVAKVYREKLKHLVNSLGKILEPAMMVFVGILFAVMIWGLLLPVYDLVGNIK
ncbi:type II secretion system F family protein [Desulfonauticus submarinus]